MATRGGGRGEAREDLVEAAFRMARVPRPADWIARRERRSSRDRARRRNHDQHQEPHGKGLGREPGAPPQRPEDELPSGGGQGSGRGVRQADLGNSSSDHCDTGARSLRRVVDDQSRANRRPRCARRANRSVVDGTPSDPPGVGMLRDRQSRGRSGDLAKQRVIDEMRAGRFQSRARFFAYLVFTLGHRARPRGLHE